MPRSSKSSVPRTRDLVVQRAGQKKARAVLEQADVLSDNVCFHRWRTNRYRHAIPAVFFSATRPSRHSGLLALHFQFNGWAKYSNYKLDEKIGARMAKAAGARIM